jgi:hypothetical protein
VSRSCAPHLRQHRSAPRLYSGKEKVEEVQVELLEAAALPWPISEVVIAKEGKTQLNVFCIMVLMFDGEISKNKPCQWSAWP